MYVVPSKRTEQKRVRGRGLERLARWDLIFWTEWTTCAQAMNDLFVHVVVSKMCLRFRGDA